MPYIGVAPSSGLFKKLDSISIVNNQAAYTMQYNSSNFKPATAEQLIVSVNGVIQAPNDAYTVSGSTITFSENLVTGDVIDFIVALGEVGNTVTPVDGSVDINKMSSSLMTESGGSTTLKIDNIQNSSGTSALSIDSSGRVTQPSKTAFSVMMSADQSISTAGTWHTVSNLNVTNNSADHVSFVKGGATVPNGVFTAPVAGVYVFHANLRYDGIGSGYFWSMLSKNDSNSPDQNINYLDGSPSTAYTTQTLDGIYNLEAGDTVRVKVYSSTDTSVNIQNYSMFQGYLL